MQMVCGEFDGCYCLAISAFLPTSYSRLRDRLLHRVSIHTMSNDGVESMYVARKKGF